MTPGRASVADRAEMTDAVLRFVEGLDDADAGLAASAFTADATADLSALSEAIGFLDGRDAIVARLVGHVGPMETTHQVGNVRVWVDGDAGELTCYVLAQHFRPGEGRDPLRGGLLMGNRYRATLVRVGEGWLIRTIAVRGVWAEGDPTVPRSVP